MLSRLPQAVLKSQNALRASRSTLDTLKHRVASVRPLLQAVDPSSSFLQQARFASSSASTQVRALVCTTFPLIFNAYSSPC